MVELRNHSAFDGSRLQKLEEDPREPASGVCERPVQSV